MGQNIEFYYCCCHACFALHDAGYETIMVNCNPETVSTDYDTSDRLYFEPLTAEDVIELARVELELFSNVDSSEMQPELWSQIAEHLHQQLPDFDGAVVTHGTDTLAYTASALSFMLQGLKKPVVLTGSQRPLGEIRSDARLNLIDAVTAAVRGRLEMPHLPS